MPAQREAAWALLADERAREVADPAYVEAEMSRLSRELSAVPYTAVAIGEILPSGNAIRLFTFAPPAHVRRFQGRLCLEADEGLRGLMEDQLDAVVYASTHTACSELAQFFHRAGCEAAVAVRLTRSRRGGLYVLVVGLNVPKPELGQHLLTLLSLAGMGVVTR